MLVGLAVLAGVVAALLVQQRPLAGFGPSASPTGVALPAAARAVLDESDGVIPDETPVSVFAGSTPGVARLDPGLRDALRRAASAATEDGVTIGVSSGWRSPAYQRALLDAAVAEYGSAEKAARWVATPETSAHVSGEAVDVAPSRAADWLAEHGAGYGLCRIYRNEPWHFELRPEAAHDGCPRRYADPTEDPRLRP